MKSILALFTFFLTCSLAQAATLTELRPAGPVAGTNRWQCAATGFVDDQIVGACQEKHYSTGRYAQATIVGTWSVSWDASGNPTLDMQTPTAWPGCLGTSDVVIVNQSPYYYISADSTGRELVENYCDSYVVTP